MQDFITNDGGLQYVSQIAAAQIIYLDFDGEVTAYNGEEAAVSAVEVQDSGLTAEQINNILTELNAKYADENVLFVAERPTAGEYSTIFVGKTEAADSKSVQKTVLDLVAEKLSPAFNKASYGGAEPKLLTESYSISAASGKAAAVEDLLNVSGIGEKKLEQIRPYIKVQDE